MSNPRGIAAFAALSVAMLFLAACGSGEAELGDAGGAVATEAAPATTLPETTIPEITLPPRPPSDYAGFRAQPPACGATAPETVSPMSFPAPEDQGLDPAIPVAATITTSCGKLVVELDPGIAPATVNSFVFLARQGYFDGSVSHRIVPGFVIQAGDQTATGREGPGYTIPDELPEAGFTYERGTLAMANAGPNTTGSQFFIVLADAPLSPDFSVFGRVVDGFDVLDRIAAVPLGPNAFGEVSVPLETLYIETVTIAEQPAGS
jgi:cyclophilin family peptidyl-prolyl cis-trans isomerase